MGFVAAAFFISFTKLGQGPFSSSSSNLVFDFVSSAMAVISS